MSQDSIPIKGTNSKAAFFLFKHKKDKNPKKPISISKKINAKVNPGETEFMKLKNSAIVLSKDK